MKKYLIIGLGSMGRRRVRCLKALGVESSDIYGMDIRNDRCTEAAEKYGINIIKNVDEVDFSEVKAMVISLPPDKHFEGVQIAFEHGKPVFVEASVVLEDVLKIKESNTKNIFVAPSCTFIFHPVIKEIRKLVRSEKYGKVCNFTYHSGQFLPDWHPWEDVNDFYVSNRLTGGAREIVPYELTWIVDVLGYPNEIKGYFRKTASIGCDIEDSYVCSLDYGDMVGSLLVDVVGRNAMRNLVINFENAQLQWRCDREQLEIYVPEIDGWESIEIGEMLYEEGYSKAINENMYIDEIDAFLKGIEKPDAYPNTIEKDIKVLEMLKAIEDSDGGFDRK
ncbi:MAG TPA: gfo/Idh/MocA family oxidoreductase [Lachnospiraceae bacterium]|nr:gfo/Idh/MocA family oxidoreductase [Lachnospiraceae bacterium]